MTKRAVILPAAIRVHPESHIQESQRRFIKDQKTTERWRALPIEVVTTSQVREEPITQLAKRRSLILVGITPGWTFKKEAKKRRKRGFTG